MSLVAQHIYTQGNYSRQILVHNAGVISCVSIRTLKCKQCLKRKKVRARIMLRIDTLAVVHSTSHQGRPLTSRNSRCLEHNLLELPWTIDIHSYLTQASASETERLMAASYLYCVDKQHTIYHGGRYHYTLCCENIKSCTIHPECFTN